MFIEINLAFSCKKHNEKEKKTVHIFPPERKKKEEQVCGGVDVCDAFELEKC